MHLLLDVHRRDFSFNFNARTSRGAMETKRSWIIAVRDAEHPTVVGYGECGPLPGLSPESSEVVEKFWFELIDAFAGRDFERADIVDTILEMIPAGMPSVVFALETALHDLLNGGRRVIFENSFVKGNPIPINGLVWMGDIDFMEKQARKKVSAGYDVIKIKVGGLNFDDELKLLERFRKSFPAITLRLDANGALGAAAMEKLKALARFDVHSIEQPVQPNDVSLATICASSPIPVALDESLIGQEYNKDQLLDEIRPQYIILKPTLHGGLGHCANWIAEANARGIGWWITSALESNIGLNAICQFTAAYDVSIAQGLGTGSLYHDNFPSPLTVSEGVIFHDSKKRWEIAL